MPTGGLSIKAVSQNRPSPTEQWRTATNCSACPRKAMAAGRAESGIPASWESFWCSSAAAHRIRQLTHTLTPSHGAGDAAVSQGQHMGCLR
jgi:hypothetical protein